MPIGINCWLGPVLTIVEERQRDAPPAVCQFVPVVELRAPGCDLTDMSAERRQGSSWGEEEIGRI